MICCAKRCRCVATRAFDVWNPWPDGKGKDRRHYEVCNRHANEFWSRMPKDGGMYVDRNEAERIRDRLVPA